MATNAFGDEIQQPLGAVNAFGDPIAGASAISPRRAKDMSDAVISGLQSSALGLALRGKLPSQQLGEDAPWYQRLAAGAAGMAADLPLNIAGGFGGMVAGTAVAPGVGTVVGGGAGAFAVPMALRDALMTAYSQNHAASWAGVWDITKAALTGGAKGAVIGAVTGGAGIAAKGVLGVAESTAGRLAQGVGVAGTELAAMTTSSAALEGHMPTLQDFADNAILLGGFKAANHVAKGMFNIYSQTGRGPSEVVGDAAANPEIATQLIEPRTPTQAAMDREVYARREAEAVMGYPPDRARVREIRAEVEGEFKANAAVEQSLYEKLTEQHAPVELPAFYEPMALQERIKNAIDAEPRPEALRSAMQDRDAPPKLGTPGEHDPVKYEYITDSDTLKGVLPQLEALYKPEIDAQTRGVVPDKEAAARGLRMAVNGDVAEHIIGSAEPAEMIRARGHVLTGFSNRAFDLMRKLHETPDGEQTPLQRLEALSSIEQLAMAVADFRGARAEAGRALRAYRAMKMDGDSFAAEALVKLYEQKGDLTDLAKKIAQMKDPSQLQKFAEGYVKATTFEQVVEAWKAALVSGPMTHIANIMGNIGKFAVDVVEKPVAASLFAIDRAVKNDPISWAQWRARAFSPVIGLALASKDGLHVAASAYATLAEKGLAEGGKELAKAGLDRLEQGDASKGEIHRPAIPGKIGAVVRSPFTALQIQDLLFRTVGERGQANVLAVDRAVKESYPPDTQEGRERIALYLDNPEYGLSPEAAKAARQSIEQAGSESVFSQKLGKRMQFVQLAMQGSTMQFVVPFFRTPVNLLSWAVQHTPGMNLMSARWLEDFKAGGERQANAAARVVVGLGLTTMAYSLAESGLLTGGGIFDQEQRGAKEAAGIQKYSVKIGDKYYSYQRMEPVAKVLGMAADLIELQKNLKDDDDKAKVATMLVAMFGNATVSTTYLSGLSNAINAMTDPERYSGAFMEQYASSLVPKVIGQTAQFMDPEKRQVDSTLDAIQSQIPFLREKLLPARDVWGEPKQNDRWFDFMPVATSKESHDNVKTEAVRLQLGIAGAPKFLFEKGPLKSEDERLKLTSEQRDVVSAVSGRRAMEILSPIVNSEDWKSIPDFAKAAIYKKVIQQSVAVGKMSAVPADAAEREQLRSKIIEEVLSQINDAQGGKK